MKNACYYCGSKNITGNPSKEPGPNVMWECEECGASDIVRRGMQFFVISECDKLLVDYTQTKVHLGEVLYRCYESSGERTEDIYAPLSLIQRNYDSLAPGEWLYDRAKEDAVFQKIIKKAKRDRKGGKM